MFTFFILIASVDVNKVFIVILGLLLFLLDYVLTILVYFLDGLSPFLIVIGSSLQIFLFLLPVKFELIFGMIDGIVDFLSFVWLNDGLLFATYLTTMDFEVALGNSWKAFRAA